MQVQWTVEKLELRDRGMYGRISAWACQEYMLTSSSFIILFKVALYTAYFN